MMFQRPIVKIMGEIVAQVSAELLPQLQAVDPKITAVHYEHGHPLEIIETLQHKTAANQFKYQKYPLVALFQDFPERITNTPGFEAEVRLNMVIARGSDMRFKADKRYEYNFEPVLYPIYRALMQAINDHPAFMSYGPTLIEHTKYDRLYWGREGLYGNTGNIFNDWLDCIEIRDLLLNVNVKLC